MTINISDTVQYQSATYIVKSINFVTKKPNFNLKKKKLIQTFIIIFIAI